MDNYLAIFHPEITFVCPQLPCQPAEMWSTLQALFEKHKNDDVALMGSSLGGYLATKAVQEYGFNAVLINPVSGPVDIPEALKGEQTHPYLNETYTLDENYIEQASKLRVDHLAHPENFMVLLQENDMLLDHTLALEKYNESTVICEPGGDHSFLEFDRHIPTVLKFLFDVNQKY